MDENKILFPNFELDATVLFDSDLEEDDSNTGNNELMDTLFLTPTATDNNTPVLIATTTALTPVRPPIKRRRAESTTKREIELIDLVTPQKQMPTTTISREYIPRTIHADNQQRLSILPTFPPSRSNNNNNSDSLLLANVSSTELSSLQLSYRQSEHYEFIFQIINPRNSTTTTTTTSSWLLQYYQIYYESIVERFKLHLAIIDHNYLRLKQVFDLFRMARLRKLPAQKQTEQQQQHICLQDHELPQILEFYLQMDVDLFYMKTCSFRNAQPRSIDEGIFCGTTQPTYSYTITPCGECFLCQTTIQTKYQQSTQLQVPFNQYRKHRFVNGYESILNCPATCNTTNIIYVLTCLCGQYDYISETSYTLMKRYENHRSIANNLLRKLLLGEKNIARFKIRPQQTAFFLSDKEYMSLYKHVQQCSTPIQMFLDTNQHYWRFVPMRNQDADEDNMYYQGTTSATTTSTLNSREEKEIRKCLNDLPCTPSGYKFSQRQIEKQTEFFKRHLNFPIVDEPVNVFNANIVAVLPLNASNTFRQFLHSLFVTHTEAKLNTLGHMFDSNIIMTNIGRSIWCENLVRPTLSLVSHRR